MFKNSIFKLKKWTMKFVKVTLIFEGLCDTENLPWFSTRFAVLSSSTINEWEKKNISAVLHMLGFIITQLNIWISYIYYLYLMCFQNPVLLTDFLDLKDFFLVVFHHFGSLMNYLESSYLFEIVSCLYHLSHENPLLLIKYDENVE